MIVMSYDDDDGGWSSHGVTVTRPPPDGTSPETHRVSSGSRWTVVCWPRSRRRRGIQSRMSTGSVWISASRVSGRGGATGARGCLCSAAVAASSGAVVDLTSVVGEVSRGCLCTAAVAASSGGPCWSRSTRMTLLGWVCLRGVGLRNGAAASEGPSSIRDSEECCRARGGSTALDDKSMGSSWTDEGRWGDVRGDDATCSPAGASASEVGVAVLAGVVGKDDDEDD